MKGRRLIGKEVVGARGWKIGKVKDIVFDEGSWRIGSLEVRLHRAVAQEYQMRHLLTRSVIEADVSSIRAVGDQVLLSVGKTDLRRMLTPSGRLARVAVPALPA